MTRHVRFFRRPELDIQLPEGRDYTSIASNENVLLAVTSASEFIAYRINSDGFLSRHPNGDSPDFEENFVSLSYAHFPAASSVEQNVFLGIENERVGISDRIVIHVLNSRGDTRLREAFIISGVASASTTLSMDTGTTVFVADRNSTNRVIVYRFDNMANHLNHNTQVLEGQYEGLFIIDNMFFGCQGDSIDAYDIRVEFSLVGDRDTSLDITLPGMNIVGATATGNRVWLIDDPLDGSPAHLRSLELSTVPTALFFAEIIGNSTLTLPERGVAEFDATVSGSSELTVVSKTAALLEAELDVVVGGLSWLLVENDSYATNAIRNRGLGGRDDIFALEIVYQPATGDEVIVRIVRDTVSHMIRRPVPGSPTATDAYEFMAVAFDVEIPQSKEGERRTASITMDNVGQEMMALIEASKGGRDVTMKVLRMNPPANIGEELRVSWEMDMSIGTIEANNQSVVISLVDQQIFGRPSVILRYDPDTAPGLF